MKTYTYRFTGHGSPPVFRTPVRKTKAGLFEFGCPIQHPDFEAVPDREPADIEPSDTQETSTRKGSKKNSKTGEE